ncbi:MAG: acetyl-CoA carboxylase carboxyltransferase subunit alpha [Gammaproteobacteria bacterium]|nr:acetyl-CoA carboxylase carboxyltransferase subunit alpha [Gammaproteobacteria bacterium]
MDLNFLEFEQPIAEVEAKIEELKRVQSDGDVDLNGEINRLEKKSHKLTESIFSSLNSWQITQLARHPQRPYSVDYIERIVSDFQELHGDRMYSDDPAIVAGIGRIDNIAVAIIAHQKGRDTKQKVWRNFGMPKPEGYRKAERIMRLAQRFKLPLISLIDTPGAYPGVGAEERGQSEAIASCLNAMAELKVPIVAVVIGEGGSGGALAIGVCDRLLMLEYATYSVISPEGCASILWKSAEKAADAAEAMGVTTKRLRELGIVDKVIEEPQGGAHRDMDEAARLLKQGILSSLEEIRELGAEQLVQQRYERLMSIGRYEEST